MNQIDELTHKFHSFELESVRQEDWELWEAVRFDVYYRIQGAMLNADSPPLACNKNKEIHSFWQKIWQGLSFVKACMARKQVLFFAASRFLNIQGEQYDPNITDVYALVKNDALIIDSYISSKPYEYDVVINRILSIIYRIYSHFPFSVKFPDSLIIEVNRHFDVIIEPRFYNQLICRYLSEKYFYTILLKLLRPKVIFITQNGIQKGLFAVAKYLGIPVVEFQHGIIYFSHLAYSYPQGLDSDLLNLPTYFFAFSEFWKKKIESCFPVEEICVSGNTKANEIYIGEKKYDLTFICTTAYMKRFLQIVSELRECGYAGKICLKLHPQQQNEVDHLRAITSSDKDIEVIYTEFSIKEIIGHSANIFAIQSTSVYEALDARKPVFLLKEMSYMVHQDVFAHPLVTLIEDMNDLKKCLQSEDSYNDMTDLRFFEPFHKERVLSFLHDKFGLLTTHS